MAWIVLLIAGVCETGLVVGLHYAAGFSRLWPSVFTAAAGLASFYLLSVAMQSIPVGTAYAIWTSIGAAGAVAYGILFLGDQASILRFIGIGLVIGGVVVLRISSPEAA
jgi:quaternary ammonium compound-resistance protein SugE